MSRDFRPNAREAAVISRLDHAKEAQRQNTLHQLRTNHEELSHRVALKLIEEKLVETTSQDELEDQIYRCIGELLVSEEFEVNYETANLRSLVPRPNFASLYITAFIVEKLIDHPSIVDIFGTDEEIYHVVNNQVQRFLTQ